MSVVVARDLLPLMPDQKGFTGTKEVSDTHQEIFPAQLKQKSMASFTSTEALIVDKKAKYNIMQKEKKEASVGDTEEERRNGVSRVGASL